MDFNSKTNINPSHATIRQLYDMPLSRYIDLLETLAGSAEKKFTLMQEHRA